MSKHGKEIIFVSYHLYLHSPHKTEILYVPVDICFKLLLSFNLIWYVKTLVVQCLQRYINKNFQCIQRKK